MDCYQDRYNDQDQLFEQMLFARNPKTHNEFARLVDLYKMRLESNPNSYRQIIDHFEASQNNRTPESSQINQIKNLIPQLYLQNHHSLLPT